MSVLPKRFCFRFLVRTPRINSLWAEQTTLTDAHLLPRFEELESAVPRRGKFEVRLGWNNEGIVLSLEVTGKNSSPHCLLMQPDECEGIQICLDTRDVRNVHRATRFCHRFFIVPSGSGPTHSDPAVLWLPIARAKGVPNSVDAARIKVRSQVREDGYTVEAAFPADCLTGFDPQTHPRLGFHYAIIDRELGNRYWITPASLPQDQDPSLWGTIELVG